MADACRDGNPAAVTARGPYLLLKRAKDQVRVFGLLLAVKASARGRTMGQTSDFDKPG